MLNNPSQVNTAGLAQNLINKEVALVINGTGIDSQKVNITAINDFSTATLTADVYRRAESSKKYISLQLIKENSHGTGSY